MIFRFYTSSSTTKTSNCCILFQDKETQKTSANEAEKTKQFIANEKDISAKNTEKGKIVTCFGSDKVYVYLYLFA